MTIELAKENEKNEIMDLYKMQLGREFCPWNEYYPAMDNIETDLAKDALIVCKNEIGKIIAAISLEYDEAVEKLDCWSPALAPSGELARLAVHPDFQNQGIAQNMLKFAMAEYKRRGYNGIHFLVNRHNTKALRSYEHLHFTKVGECHMYEQDFFCYEQAL